MRRFYSYGLNDHVIFLLVMILNFLYHSFHDFYILIWSEGIHTFIFVSFTLKFKFNWLKDLKLKLNSKIGWCSFHTKKHYHRTKFYFKLKRSIT